MEISAKTRLLVVIGDPVAHSLSPAMHNAACRALGIDAVYVAIRVTPQALPAVLAMQRATGGAGNVTVPHKEAVEGSVTRKTDVCARVGACNTFWTEGSDLVGDNTDVVGVSKALAQIGVAEQGGRWLVIGTGGSARAVAAVAAERGAALWVRSRDADRARQFVVWGEWHRRGRTRRGWAGRGGRRDQRHATRARRPRSAAGRCESHPGRANRARPRVRSW